MSASRRILSALACAALTASCVQLGYRRDIVEEKPPARIVESFVVGTTGLGDVLAQLGAPLDVWEAGGGSIALTYGGLRNQEWGADVSIPVTEATSASFSYTDSHARTQGWLLLFDRSDRLELVRAGMLGDLRLQFLRRRPASVDDEPAAADPGAERREP